MVPTIVAHAPSRPPEAVVVVVPGDKRAWATQRCGCSDDWDRLETIAAIGPKVTLLENDQRVIDLHVARPPGR